MELEYPQSGWKDYELMDSGDFEKLERFGEYILIRPEPKALWDKSLSESEWESAAHVRFVPGAGFGKAGKEDSGRWKMLRKMPEQWPISYCNDDGLKLRLRLGLTAFKHVGVFPEQAPNWDFVFRRVKSMQDAARSIDRKEGSYAGSSAEGGIARPRILNLFAYTGAASLAAREAGADVTHLDAVRQVVTWANENQSLSGLDGIRWIVEDALKFVKREVRRGNSYDGIILDPPAYGHGPDGERWKLDECLFELLKNCAAILAPKNSFVLLNLYSNGYSAVLADSLARCAFGGGGGFGELILKDSFGKSLPLSVFSRIIRN
ncbi:MAG: class I SAM-dependent methyltransferase [Bacteroidales bacterium]|jgi:23S rRNA (cytosine1962-C5)-methyltransferase|nr:class I SAM-dependent methyltransferase [Bacteroidales bacterium]MCI2121094.1 class I SAM-dependent methyltransferase [Bacteroidales bacterium]MCI2144909.1 class I SAM-dependent methyltransferase [Bacteroidales bacterium]